MSAPGRRLLSVVVTGLVAATAACTTVAAPSAGAPTLGDCAPAAARGEDPGGPVFAVVVAAAPDGRARVDRMAAFARVVDAGFDAGARLLVVRAGAGAQDADLIIDRTLVGHGANELFRKADRRCVSRALAAQVAVALAADGEATPDTVGALRVLRTHLDAAAPGRPVEVAVLGPFSVGELADPGSLAFPGAVIDQLEADHRLPDCRDWTVAVVAGSPPVATGGDNRPSEWLWPTLFERCEGRLVFTGARQLSAFPADGEAILPPPPAPPLSQMVEPTAIVLTLAGDVLFAPGRAELAPSAEAALTGALDSIRRYPGAPLKVAGHTDAVGDEGSNLALSERRAVSVSRWLVRHGAAPEQVTTVGVGESEPASAGTPDDWPANRRVVITITVS